MSNLIFGSFNEYIINELSNNSTLYHRTTEKLKVGDIIKPNKTKGTHWLEKNNMELALEGLREQKYSKKPSRFSCIFSSVIPRSRFVDKGYLYTIRPIGKMHMPDSTLIDQMDRKFNDNFMDSYEYYKDMLKTNYKKQLMQ